MVQEYQVHCQGYFDVFGWSVSVQGTNTRRSFRLKCLLIGGKDTAIACKLCLTVVKRHCNAEPFKINLTLH